MGIWFVCTIFALLGFAVVSDNKNISIAKNFEAFYCWHI